MNALLAALLLAQLPPHVPVDYRQTAAVLAEGESDPALAAAVRLAVDDPAACARGIEAVILAHPDDDTGLRAVQLRWQTCFMASGRPERGLAGRCADALAQLGARLGGTSAGSAATQLGSLGGYRRGPGGGGALSAWFWTIFSWLFGTYWGWVLILGVGLPIVQRRIFTFARKQSFLRSQRANLVNPIDFRARFQLGAIYHKGRRWRLARDWFIEALKAAERAGHTPEVDPLLYQMLGDAFLRLGKGEEALKSFEAGLDADPESGRGEAEAGIAECHLRAGRLAEAARWADKSCAANSTLARAVWVKARTAAAKGDHLLARTLRRDYLRGASELPDYARRMNRRYAWAMRLGPLARWVV
jgi:tetratricopeptide (TPR) repeat protein